VARGRSVQERAAAAALIMVARKSGSEQTE
jgi:hypothetical protein